MTLGRVPPPVIEAASDLDVTDTAELGRYRDLFLRAPAIYLVTDTDGTVRDANAAALAFFHVPAGEILGTELLLLTTSDARRDLAGRLASFAAGGATEEWEVRFDVPGRGAGVTAIAAVSDIRDRRGRILGLRWVLHDITERKRAESRIAHLAFHDGLTGLPNKLLFDELVTLALARARRDGSAVALLYLDLDSFKEVNDRLGHSSGDDLLQQIAGRLITASRRTDAVARLGGDEFAVLLADLRITVGSAPGYATALRVAARIRRALAAPYTLPDGAAHVEASVGIAVFPSDASNEQDLMRTADAAMYEVKRGKTDAGWAEAVPASRTPGARRADPVPRTGRP